jgi:ATP-dependent RNA helicase DeaD
MAIMLNTFEELGIQASFVKGLKELAIITPTVVQQKVIPLLLSSKTDLVAQAQTGTGKTAAFGLPLLQQIDATKQTVQGLILCPTRELGQQVAKQLFRFTKYSDKIFTEAVYGGEPIGNQITRLRRPTHIVVATPGRLIDLLERKALDLSQVKTVILDEADEMLSMGFKAELDQVLSFLPSTVQNWLFSATLPSGIKQIITKHMDKDAPYITLNKEETINKSITHQYILCKESEKLGALTLFLAKQHKKRGIVFCKTKVAAQKLVEQLEAEHLSVAAIHGDLQQRDREKAMRAFKNESARILVATDIAARGIDIVGLAFVLHYQMPDKAEYYTHRSGRTARAGKEGISLCFLTTYDMELLKQFENELHIRFQRIE